MDRILQQPGKAAGEPCGSGTIDHRVINRDRKVQQLASLQTVPSPDSVPKHRFAEMRPLLPTIRIGFLP